MPVGSCEGQNNTVKQPLQGELQEQQQHTAQKVNTRAKSERARTEQNGLWQQFPNGRVYK